MKTLIFALFLLCVYPTVNAQVQDTIIRQKPNNSIADIDTLMNARNHRFIFEYDTVYIINKYGVITFLKCANELNKLKRDVSGQLNSLSDDLSLIHVNVDSLYSGMKSVSAFINDYERDTKFKLESLSTTNAKLTDNMSLIQTDLDEAKQKLKAERWNSMGTKALWGGGGFALGALIFTSLLLLK